MNEPLFHYNSLEEAWPTVDPEYQPSGHFVLFQLRTPLEKSVGGIIMPDTLRDDMQWTTQVAKVVALGPGAFKSRDTLVHWPEGPWGKVGDFVRVPAFGGDRWFVPVPGSKMKALFAQFRDLDLKGQFFGDPLKVDTY